MVAPVEELVKVEASAQRLAVPFCRYDKRWIIFGVRHRACCRWRSARASPGKMIVILRRCCNGDDATVTALSPAALDARANISNALKRKHQIFRISRGRKLLALPCLILKAFVAVTALARPAPDGAWLSAAFFNAGVTTVCACCADYCYEILQ